MGTATYGGEGGDSGDINGCTFPPEHGQAWAGGNGGQYGGGGGSGCVGQKKQILEHTYMHTTIDPGTLDSLRFSTSQGSQHSSF